MKCLFRNALVLVFALLSLGIGTLASAHAEMLDEVSIRKLYADEAKIDDPITTQVVLGERLDKDFTLKESSTRILYGQPSETSTATYNKEETITNAVKSAKASHFDTKENKILSIVFSDDHKYAYVTDTTARSGTISSSSLDGNFKSIHFEDGESCLDKLFFNGNEIKLMQSICNEQFVTKK